MEQNFTFNEPGCKNWNPTEKAVITFIIDEKNNKILLIHKKTGLGKGLINAPGGRIEKGESAREAAIRECEEEVSVIPKNPEKRAELFFRFTSGYSMYGEAFFATTWEGQIAESPEAKPFWCDLNNIPWAQMWQDDRLWLPRALAGEKLRGYFEFDDKTLIAQKLETCAGW